MEVLMHEASKGPDENKNSTCCDAYQEEGAKDELEMPLNTDSQLTKIKKDDYMDITFENITYNVSLGFRKGILNYSKQNEYFFQIFLYFLRF